MCATVRPTLTDDDYLAFERAADARHELINGELVAMAGGSMLHSAVCTNIVAELRLRLRGRTWRPFESNLRVHVAATGLYCYPDVTVVCGEPERHPKDRHTLLNPSLLVEVLSPATRNIDLGEKAEHYRALPGLAAFLMVDPLARKVGVYVRQPDDIWNLRSLGMGESVKLVALDLEIPVAEFFADTDDLRAAELTPPATDPEAAG